MKKIRYRKLLAILLFATGIILWFISTYFPGERIIIGLQLSISSIYLFFGWYLLKGYFPQGEPLLLFLIGYLYSSIFLSSAFVSADWPLALILIKTSIAWLSIQITLIIILRKKMDRYGFVQFLIEAGLMALLIILSMF